MAPGFGYFGGLSGGTVNAGGTVPMVNRPYGPEKTGHLPPGGIYNTGMDHENFIADRTGGKREPDHKISSFKCACNTIAG